MKKLSLILTAVLLCTVATAAEPKLLPRTMLEEGWIQLFDGQSLFGWQPVGDAKWQTKDGIVSTDGSKPGFLMSTTRWAEYELRLDFRAPNETNSGVFLRTVLDPTDPAKDCYELNIAPADNPFPTGSLVKRQKTLHLPPGEPKSPPLPPGEGRGEGESPKTTPPTNANNDGWHTFKITAWTGWISVELDGVRVADYQDPNPLRIGHIALQSNSGPVEFRSIILRPIELMPLLASADLSNFNTERAEKSEFEVTADEVLHVRNGPGQLETNKEYANFVFQIECQVNGDGLNSGIFYRTLREGRWTGYESQINNVFKNGDRTKPADFGTGAIYRRQPARRVVPNDREWFTKTIVADGPHVAVWVDGLQVTDWTDERPDHKSPREGRRLGPGVIAIQGHDPTTDFLFRKFRIAELPVERPEVGGRGSGQ